MAFLTDAAGGILDNEEIAKLIVEPITQESVAMQVATPHPTERPSVRFPKVTDDVEAGWYDEGEDISLTDPTVDEVNVTPKKIAALVKVSTELAEDSSPEATEIVRMSLARSAARVLDRAFFGDTTEKGPDGVLSTSFQTVSAGSVFDGLDAFTQAQTKAEKVGARITGWVGNADTVEDLSLLKAFTGDTNSKVPLLQPDPTRPALRQINGSTLYSVADTVALPDGYIFGFDRSRTFVVIRRDVKIDIDASVFFGSDSLGVRLTMRVGFGFTHDESTVLVAAGGS